MRGEGDVFIVTSRSRKPMSDISVKKIVFTLTLFVSACQRGKGAVPVFYGGGVLHRS